MFPRLNKSNYHSGEGVLSFQNLCLILLQNDHAIKYVHSNQIKSTITIKKFFIVRLINWI